MTKFRISYRGILGEVAPPPDEEVEAMMYLDVGDWIDFYSTAMAASPTQQRHAVVLRVRAKDVQRIERINDT